MERLNDLKPVLFRHLDVQKNEIGPLARDSFDGLDTVAAFADELDVILIAEKALYAISGERFVVDNYGANGHGMGVVSYGSNRTYRTYGIYRTYRTYRFYCLNR